MTGFYNTNGKPIAYTQDGTHIYLFSGKPVAYISGDSVYSFGGKYLGWFEDGWILDNNGYCVFFTKNARGGPAKPARKAKPAKGARGARPAKGAKSPKPAKPTMKYSWSSDSSASFFS